MLMALPYLAHVFVGYIYSKVTEGTDPVLVWVAWVHEVSQFICGNVTTTPLHCNT